MKRTLASTLLLAALLATAAAASAKDFSIVAVDGYLRGERHAGIRMLVLTDHDGGRYLLVGKTFGLTAGDHVRLLGRRVPDGRDGRLRGRFEVTEVEALWADDRHKTVYFDHLENGAFDRYAERYRYRPQEAWGDGRAGRDPWRDDSWYYGNWGEWRLPYHYGRHGLQPPY